MEPLQILAICTYEPNGDAFLDGATVWADALHFFLKQLEMFAEQLEPAPLISKLGGLFGPHKRRSDVFLHRAA